MKRISTAWVFVSHSTKDMEKVRRVRDAIEDAGSEPILFFLKCLGDHDEIDDLIAREIQARNFFLLCDSSNARDSDWVQAEIAHVKSLGDKRVENIDLDGDRERQINGIQSQMKQATVFLSYARKDEALVAQVRSALIANDFSVWDPSDDLDAGDDWGKQLSAAVEASARFGYFLHFLSTASLSSKWVARETQKALAAGIGRYLPILLDPISPSQVVPPFLRERQWIDFTSRNLDVTLSVLLRAMGVKNTEQQGGGYSPPATRLPKPAP
ncbi:MAG: toll/interleukin-1 receptor domain-containing protein [Candidatus Zhuqueibacterota bacterium]